MPSPSTPQADVEAQCAAERQQLLAGQGRGVVLQCLVAKFTALSGVCLVLGVGLARGAQACEGSHLYGGL